MKKLYSLVLLMLVLALPLTACAITGRVAEKEAEVKAEVQEAVEKMPEPTATALPGEEPGATVVPEEKAGEDEQAGALPTRAAEEPTPSPEEASPVAEEPSPQPATGPSIGLVLAAEESLDSFRKQITTRTQQEGGSWGPEVKMELTWVREPEAATHMIMYDESGVAGAEMISIGDKQWVKIGEMWVMSEGAETSEQAEVPGDWDRLMREAQQAMEGGMSLVGEETVNGVHCKHYSVDAQVAIPFPLPQDAAQEAEETLLTEFVLHQKGDMWIADQSDLPQVAIRTRTEAHMTTKSPSGDEVTAIQQQIDLFEINEPVTIERPSDEEIGAAAGEYPMVPDAQIGMASENMTLYTTASSVEQVVAFYEAEMPAAGWAQEGTTNLMMDIAMMQFTKEAQSVNVTISPAEEGGTQVMLMTGQ